MPRRPRNITHKAWFIGEDGRKPGKLYRTARLFWTGDNTEQSGGANTVGFSIARTAQGKRKGVEKRFYREFNNPERDYRILREFEAAGAHIVPGVRLVITKKAKGKIERSLEMPDLTERGKKVVFPINSVVRNKKLQKLVEGLKNSKEIFDSMHHDSLILRKLQYSHNGDLWLFVIDKKTNTGKVYLADVDAVFHSNFMTNARLFGEEQETKYLEHFRAGTVGIKQTFTTIKGIVKRSENLALYSAGLATSKAVRHRALLVAALKETIAENKKRFELINKTGSEIMSVVARQQDSATAEKSDYNRGKQLNKAQRRHLRKVIAESNKHSRYLDEPTPYYVYARMYYPKAPDKGAVFTARRMKFSQTLSAGVGVYASEKLKQAEREQGEKLFGFDRKEVAKYPELIRLLNNSDSQRAAQILKENKQVLRDYLIYTAYTQFQKDLSYIGRAKTRNRWTGYGVMTQRPMVFESK